MNTPNPAAFAKKAQEVNPDYVKANSLDATDAELRELVKSSHLPAAELAFERLRARTWES